MAVHRSSRIAVRWSTGRLPATGTGLYPAPAGAVDTPSRPNAGFSRSGSSAHPYRPPPASHTAETAIGPISIRVRAQITRCAHSTAGCRSWESRAARLFRPTSGRSSAQVGTGASNRPDRPGVKHAVAVQSCPCLVRRQLPSGRRQRIAQPALWKTNPPGLYPEARCGRLARGILRGRSPLRDDG